MRIIVLKCYFTESCHFAEYYGAECHYIYSCQYAECHYAECYAEYRNAI